MGGSISSGRNNDELVDHLVESDYLKSPHLQHIFRSVDRGDYYSKGDRATAYRDSAYRHGNLHLSAPCIYSEVMEALKLRSGLSFLNLGSGSGYLSTVAGLVLGRYGTNHGIELFNDVVDFAYHRLEEFLKHSEAVDAYEFCEPRFFVGNCLKLDSCNMQLYDRVYCGAACPEEHEEYMKSLIKVGGILVMPLNNKLLQITRTGERSWTSSKVLSVSFAPLNCPKEEEVAGFLKLPDIMPPRLLDICRSKVRTVLRDCIDIEHPELPQKKNAPLNKNKRRVRRIVIPIVDESESASGNSRNNSDEDDDDDNHSASVPIKYTVSTRVPSRTTAFIENFMKCRANVDEVVAGPSNWRGEGSSNCEKDEPKSSSSVSLPEEPKTETLTNNPEDSGISDSDMNTDEDKSISSDPEMFAAELANLNSKLARVKTRRKRQHSGSEQRNAKTRKRVASYPRLKLRTSATVGYIWKRIPPDDVCSDPDKEVVESQKEKPAESNEPNYTTLMMEKIKFLPLPRPLLDYMSYRRNEN